MKSILFCLSVVLVAGCNTTSYVHTNKDGSSDSFHNTRWLWTNDSIDASLSPTNGVTVKSSKSAVDGEALGIVVKSAVQGAVQGTK